jgi:hypothetical protein
MPEDYHGRVNAIKTADVSPNAVIRCLAPDYLNALQWLPPADDAW